MSHELTRTGVLFGLLCLIGCSGGSRLDLSDPGGDGPSDRDGMGDAASEDASGAADAGAALPDFPETGIGARTLTVTGVNPRSGPFSGGNEVVVRGSGFTERAVVLFDGRAVQPAGQVLLDSNSLSVVVPAGPVGPADVSVRQESEEVSLADGYTYDPLFLDPRSGSIAGGTSVLVTVEGGLFEDGVAVEIGGEACTELRVISPNTLRCITPRGEVGPADVVAYWPDDGERPRIEAPGGFTYEDLTDTDRGGLSGGPIEGTVNVTVVDSAAGFAVGGAYVLLGDDFDSPYQGLTDERGQITFSGEDLQGPVTLHVAKDCMEKASIVAFDARNATVHMNPLLDPTCAMPGDPPPGGPGAAGSLISGELIFPGSDEFAVDAWDVVPEPRANEVRTAYVFTTRVRATVPNPSPAISGTIQRIVEDSSAIGVEGYPYRIFARPAGLAVYALAGLERRDTGRFTPYVMGVRRDVVTAPGDEETGIDIEMNIPLDRELAVEIVDIPPPAPIGPDRFRVRANLDLGGEGAIVRIVNSSLIDRVSSFSAGSLFRFFAQPALTGSLADARYQVIAGWYTGDNDDTAPFTEVRIPGVLPTEEPLRVDDLLSIPAVVAPDNGASLPDDRVLRWSMAGGAPDFFVVTIDGGDGFPAWEQLVPGQLTESTVPDFSTVEGLSDIAPGVITWSVNAIRIEDFVYDEFKYNLLSSRHWSHISVDTFTMQR